ncbi:hypothetical protein [Gracilibacillus suaedae]|uniref:hypothetical protein n=1 Tax=Gracilibacillus suaedae TaxID=2820273 RepID=UPI001ABE937B|nr:hypothetical protein [Gracilibacillus suaedae]
MRKKIAHLLFTTTILLCSVGYANGVIAVSSNSNHKIVSNHVLARAIGNDKLLEENVPDQILNLSEQKQKELKNLFHSFNWKTGLIDFVQSVSIRLTLAENVYSIYLFEDGKGLTLVNESSARYVVLEGQNFQSIYQFIKPKL